MKHLDVPTDRLREEFQAGHDPLWLGPVQRVSRSNCAPAYYLGRPASLWISVMKPHRRRTAAGHLA